jgi:hypothetical protein
MGLNIGIIKNRKYQRYFILLYAVANKIVFQTLIAEDFLTALEVGEICGIFKLSNFDLN